MALLKDFLLDINKKISIPGIEALAGASDLAAIEIDDDTMTQAAAKFNGLMSIDAAKNNPDLSEHFKKTLHPTIKGELLGNIDTDVASTVKNLFGDEAVEQLKEKEFTGDKIKFFGELAKAAIESKDGGDEKIKELNTNLNKQIQELNGSAEKKQKEYDKTLKKTQQEFDSKLIDKDFNAVFNSYNLGEVYSKDMFKDALRTDIRNKVNTVAKLTLSEDRSEIVPKNPTNDELELFIENKPITSLKDILDPLMQGHIKVTNVDKKNDKDKYVPADTVKLNPLAQTIQMRREQMFKE